MSETLAHAPDVKAYLDRIYAESDRAHACRATDPASFAAWQAPARQAYIELLGLARIEAGAGRGAPSVTWADEVEDLGDCTRQRGWIETEPSVRVAFWCVRPRGDGPFPLALMPHGHGEGDIYAGLTHTDRDAERMRTEDRDVALQAARRGWLAIAPATRGIGQNPDAFRVLDIAHRHDDRHCICHAWQALIVGRCAMGERVWDMMRLLDWARALPEVDGPTLMLGNSGGGMATAHTAAADERVDIAVPSCAYNNYLSPAGTLRHCPCNTVPGLMAFGEFWDVLALAAPRAVLTVNGRTDSLHPVDEVDAAAERLAGLFRSAGAEGRYEHRWGDAGHRFYEDLMWPWIEAQRSRLTDSQGE